MDFPQHMNRDERLELAHKLRREEHPVLQFLAHFHYTLVSIEDKLSEQNYWLHSAADAIDRSLKNSGRVNSLGEVQHVGAAVDALCARREQVNDLLFEYCRTNGIQPNGETVEPEDG